MSNLKPLVHNSVREFLGQTNILFSNMEDLSGPLHFIFPEIMSENIEKIKAVLDDSDIDYYIYFAHKPTKSKAFLRQARKDGIHLDVASENELNSALSCGFQGNEIECTGPKNDTYIQLAIQNGCLISVDSLSELNKIIDYKNEVNILLRISGFDNSSKIPKKDSRFGINFNDIETAFKLLKNNSNINLRGFHHHQDGYSNEVRTNIILSLYELIIKSYDEGFSPDIVNIGGSFRSKVLDNYLDLQKFMELMQESLISGTNQVWGNDNYGLYLDSNGLTRNREKIEQKFTNIDFQQQLKEIISSSNVNKKLIDADIKLMIEPGKIVLNQAGVSIFKITSIKKTSLGDNLVLVDGNIFSIGAKMFEPMTDPLLIKKTAYDASLNLERNSMFDTFVAGNLCREDDFLIRRKVTFNQIPEEGDLICFIDTGAYRQDFEDARPHMHSAGKRLVAIKNDGEFKVCSEDEYLIKNS